MTDPSATSAPSANLPAVVHLGNPGDSSNSGESVGDGYREHLRVTSLSAGRFTATPGYNDQQQPHTEDEIYYVLAGQAVLDIDGISHPVTAGSLAYVPRGVAHRFTQISTDLDVLVVFTRANPQHKTPNGRR